MPQIPLDNLGFTSPITDIDPANLPPEAFTYGFNIRAIDDKLVSYSGKTLKHLPSSSFSGGAIDAVTIASVLYYVVLGRSSCKAYNGATWTDITPASLTTTPMTTDQELDWQATKLGNIPVYNNPNHWPVYWTPVTVTPLQLLKFDATQTWKDVDFTCKVMKAHKNFLFALNMTEGGVTYPYSYRWSHPADINGLPPSWDDTDLSFIASKEQVAGNGGNIVSGESIRDAFCIYSDNAINILDYTGDEFVWRSRNLSEEYGLAAANTLVRLGDVNYFLTDGDIIANDGNSLQSILTKRNRRKLASSISASNYTNSFAVKLPNMSEVWFFLVEEGYTYPSVIYMFNTKTGTVTLRECSGILAATYALQMGADDSFDTGPSGDFDSWPGAFDDTNISPFSSQVFGLGTTDTGVYTLDLTADSYNSVLERTNFAPDGLTTATTITAVYPKITASGPVSIQVGSQQHVGGTVAWKQAIQFDPNTQRRVAIKTTGKLHAWRIFSIDNNKFSISGLTIEYELAGTR